MRVGRIGHNSSVSPPAGGYTTKVATPPRRQAFLVSLEILYTVSGFRFSHPSYKNIVGQSFALSSLFLCGMGESNSRPRFGKPILYHLTNPALFTKTNLNKHWTYFQSFDFNKKDAKNKVALSKAYSTLTTPTERR